MNKKLEQALKRNLLKCECQSRVCREAQVLARAVKRLTRDNARLSWVLDDSRAGLIYSCRASIDEAMKAAKKSRGKI